ncbi:hypothetical protein D3C75_850580 [compost metagenome]
MLKAPSQVTGGDFGIVFGVEIDAFAAQFLTQPEVIRQRAVVHQAQVGSGRKRVAAFHGHGAFGGHAGVTDDVAALHAAQAETLGDFFGQSHALENFDALTGAHDAHGRCQFAQCCAYGGFFSLDLQHNRAGVLKPVQRCAELAFKCRNQRLEVVLFGRGL